MHCTRILCANLRIVGWHIKRSNSSFVCRHGFESECARHCSTDTKENETTRTLRFLFFWLIFRSFGVTRKSGGEMMLKMDEAYVCTKNTQLLNGIATQR